MASAVINEAVAPVDDVLTVGGCDDRWVGWVERISLASVVSELFVHNGGECSLGVGGVARQTVGCRQRLLLLLLLLG